jgi:hypothetical protein
MFCSQCGADNPDGARFCGKCGAPMAAAAPAPAPAATDTVRGGGGAAPAPVVVNNSGSGMGAVSPTGKTPWVATLLSFFISGLGQMYNSDFKKGAVMFVGAVLGIWLTGGLATLAIWIWSMVDGWQVAAGKMKPW